jgi:hypothetical protein
MFEVDAAQLQRGIEALQVIRSGGPPIITRDQAANVLKALAQMELALEEHESRTPTTDPWSAP